MEVELQTIILIGGVFTGFFGLVKFIMVKQQKLTDTFLTYIQVKNGNLERVAENFSKHVERSNQTMEKVAVQLEKNSEAVRHHLENSTKNE